MTEKKLTLALMDPPYENARSTSNPHALPTTNAYSFDNRLLSTTQPVAIDSSQLWPDALTKYFGGQTYSTGNFFIVP